ncbi:MAG: HD domain-containing protein [Clostridia bacterium]|nr:HD domain-containing protein [Clostridia bacterium]
MNENLEANLYAKVKFVADLKVNDEFQDYFMVKSLTIKQGSNKKDYLDLILSDKTGEISGKKWDIAEAEIASLNEYKTGDIVRVRALVTEFNGTKQLRITKIRHKSTEDELDLNDFIKAAPEPPKAMYDFIHMKAESLGDEDLRKICLRVLDDNKEKLLYYPAAQKNHHAQLAGLLYHVKRMLMTGERICEVYTMLDRDWVVAGVILHDIEKLNEIESNEMGISPGYSFEGNMLGHLVQGVKTVEKLGEELGFSREKTIMLEHMILTHHYEPEFGSPKRPMFPEAEVLHYLDILDARLFDMQEALSGVEPGAFSEKVWTLDNRRIYKPVGDGK